MNYIVYKTNSKNKITTIISRLLLLVFLVAINISVLFISYNVLFPNLITGFIFIILILVLLDLSLYIVFNNQIKYENDTYKFIQDSFISRNTLDLQCVEIKIKNIYKIEINKINKRIFSLSIFSPNKKINISGLSMDEYIDILERLGFNNEN